MANEQTNATPARPRTSPQEFVQQVRQEVAKVSWPSRKETLITTGLVFAMSILAAVFFLLADWIISHAVRLIFNLAA